MFNAKAGVHDFARFPRCAGVADQLEIVGRLSHDDCLRRHVEGLCLCGSATWCVPHQVPAKLYEMMMFRKPIVLLAERGESAKIVERYRLGVVIAPDDEKAMAVSLKEMIEQVAAGVDYGGDYENALNAFDGVSQADSLAQFLDQLAN